MKKNQKGATLIIVLFVVLLVITIGVIAIKRSMSDLSASTVAQVDKVSFQGAEAAFSQFENYVRTNKSSATDVNLLSGFALEKAPVDTEVTLCYKQSATSLFDISTNITHRTQDKTGYINSLQSGHCDVSGDDFISQRKVGLTQLTLIQPEKDKDKAKVEEAFDGENALSSFGGNGFAGGGGGLAKLLKPKHLCAYAISVIPAFATSSTTDTAINECLQKPVIYKTDDIEATTTHVESVRGCLKALQVPIDFHVQEYEVKMQGLKVISKIQATGSCLK